VKFKTAASAEANIVPVPIAAEGAHCGLDSGRISSRTRSRSSRFGYQPCHSALWASFYTGNLPPFSQIQRLPCARPFFFSVTDGGSTVGLCRSRREADRASFKRRSLLVSQGFNTRYLPAMERVSSEGQIRKFAWRGHTTSRYPTHAAEVGITNYVS
jgi:hypothetical protein